MKYLILPLFLGSLFLVGCNASVGTTLLSSYTACTTTTSSTTDAACASTTTTTTGAIEITPNNTTLAQNIDSSDLIEITGTCRDQGRKNNRILVQVFAGDLIETVDPYIDNSTSNKCLNTASGIATGEKCFSVTKGIGLTEDSSLPDQRDFPQCHNGQFGFSVRLGKILTDAALGTNYLVRFKLRTQEGSLSDTVWSRVTVARKLRAPTIDTPTAIPTTYQCSLTTGVARFNQNIQYALQKSYVGGLTGTTYSYAVPGFGLTSASPYAFAYTDGGLIDGVTYTYSLTGTETQYAAYYGGVPQTAVSNAVTCQMPAPVLTMPSVPLANTCYFGLSQRNYTAGVGYDLAYSTLGGWAAGGQAYQALATCASGSLFSTCAVNGLASGTTYYFAVRARGSGADEVGKWSAEFSCKPP
ncbi:MAG: hypothetical protein H7256_15350 [Bdellovibrio sp.]|nr:hypothetical protein [Bdellovibrio sp.]